ncbi:MAG: imidazoleglycerol-phosphate dehydratase HisB [Opitutales bacterium]|nr:imidazoleglycerol-phosphate dehydratase HisB [Opitutales bacterium]
MAEQRLSQITRNTSETRISLSLNIDGSGKGDINTGIPFFDHMLELFARHGLFDLTVKAEGDLSVDYHHTVEDVGIVLGQALKEAVGDKKGMVRYGFFLLPMDECLARFVIDIGNRPLLDYRVTSQHQFVRDFNILLVREFFQAFANSAGANVHIELLHGDEPHHIAEAIFKAFARALDAATRIDDRQADRIPSTKGTLS